MAEDVYQRNLTEFYYDSARNVHFLYRPYENAVAAAVQVSELLKPEYPAVRCGVFCYGSARSVRSLHRPCDIVHIRFIAKRFSIAGCRNRSAG